MRTIAFYSLKGGVGKTAHGDVHRLARELRTLPGHLDAPTSGPRKLPDLPQPLHRTLGLLLGPLDEADQAQEPAHHEQPQRAAELRDEALHPEERPFSSACWRMRPPVPRPTKRILFNSAFLFVSRFNSSLIRSQSDFQTGGFPVNDCAGLYRRGAISSTAPGILGPPSTSRIGGAPAPGVDGSLKRVTNASAS